MRRMVRSAVRGWTSAAVLLCAGVFARAASVEIVEAQAPEIPAGCPTLPFVAPGDEGWTRGEPVFSLTADGADTKARGWFAVSAEALLGRIVVSDDVHVNEKTGDNIWAGDGVQLGADLLGDGPQAGKAADAEDVGRGDVSLAYALTAKGSEAWVFSKGYDRGSRWTTPFFTEANVNDPRPAGEGARPDLAAKIARDEAAKTTTYDFALPWASLGASPWSPLLGLSVQINDTDPAKSEQTRLRWGDGIAGTFKPGLFQKVAVGKGRDVAILYAPESEVTSEQDPILVRAFLSPERAYRLSASAPGLDRSLDIPARAEATGMLRYEVKAVLGGGGALFLNVALALADGEVLAEKRVSTRFPEGDAWYPFTAVSDSGPSVIGMEDWLEKPAGKRGGVRMDKGRLAFADGSPAKFWGVNNSYGGCAPDKSAAEAKAAHYAKYGVNCVRLHKWTGSGWRGIGNPNDATEMTPEGLANLDNYLMELKKRGIYVGWSHIFGTDIEVQPGNRASLKAYDEIRGQRKGLTYGLVNFAPDVQDIYIQMTVKLLRHRSALTGLTYAEEPALAFIEMHNEDDIFWPTTMDAANACPTYKAMFCEMFSDWLKKKYGSHEALVKAWGEKAINAYPEYQKDEHLDKRNVYPIAHFWWYSRDGLKDQTEKKGTRLRLLDTALFLHETQNDFYGRFAKAIREAGYQGPLVGSCWQAGDGIAQYYNLRSDWLVGIIDRHNYMGGESGTGGGVWFLRPCKFDNRSMLSLPGSGMLSVGLQMVADRPFALSEWIHVLPTEWGAEGPAIIGAYGMGLQGWDGSYAFASDGPKFTPTVQSGGLWNTEQLTHMGLYPAVARMVYRGDVKEGTVISTRRASMADLARGELSFEEKVEQQGDVKSFTGDVPAEALAAGKVVVEFVDKPQPSDRPDLKAMLERKVIRSNTGQLVWDYSEADRGFFTVDTPGTKAVVGFAPARPQKLGPVTIESDGRFVAVFVTALQKDKTLADAPSLLVTAVARTKNTDMRFNREHTELLDLGKAPVLVEPVKARVDLGRRIAAVHLLDHDGRRTERALDVKDGTAFDLDGSRDKTPYYEVVFASKERP